MTENDRKVEFIKTWSDWFYDHTETFKGALGLQLAYLWPAYVGGRKIEVSQKSAIVQILKREKVPKDSEIWDCLDIVG